MALTTESVGVFVTPKKKKKVVKSKKVKKQIKSNSGKNK